MKRGNPWLSTPAEELALAHESWLALPGLERARTPAPTFDVVVVGSGYGGAVAAARLSDLVAEEGGRRMSVAVLERGLEYTPGSFPDRLADLVPHVRVTAGGWPDAAANREGLMDWRLGGDVAALVANGLGGGSLINAGVCEPASQEALSRDDWPSPWRGNQALWNDLYARATGNLGASAWPADRVPKQATMKALAERLGAACRPVRLSIVAPDTAEGGDPPTRGCIACGDCFSGCNVGAKITLGHNYLAQAYRQGARLYTGATVHSVLAIPAPAADDGLDLDNESTPAQTDRPVQDAPQWIVRWRLTDPGRVPGDTRLFEVRARQVVLAAGTFGSTEILMRSRDAGLAVSGRLGEGFSANGDVLSAWYDTPLRTAISPDEGQALPLRGCGPTITSQIEWNTANDPTDRRKPAIRNVVQDLTVPGALGWLFRELTTTMMVPQRWTHWNLEFQGERDLDPYAVDERAIARTLLTVAYVDDKSAGSLEPSASWATGLRDGELVVRWKDPGGAPEFKTMDRTLAAAQLGRSSYLRNPLQQFMPKENYLGLGQAQRKLLTVHPLGGCRMAENARDGVVNAWGAVFNTGLGVGDTGSADNEAHRDRLAGDHARTVHSGLFILDGSIVPVALGINPLLTITALAEGAIDQWVGSHGWIQIDKRKSRKREWSLLPLPLLTLPPPPPPQRGAELPTAVKYCERMSEPPGPATEPARPRLSMMCRFDEVSDLRRFVGQVPPGAPVRKLKLNATFEFRLGGVRLGKPLSVGGQVRWLVPEANCPGQRALRTARAFLRTRFLADLAESSQRGLGVFDGLFDKLRGASHFGAVRLLEYRFSPLTRGWKVALEDGTTCFELPKGTRLSGVKRVGYHLPDWDDPEGANPWRQLTELPLEAQLPGGERKPLAVLEFDQMASLDRYDFPLEIVRQENALTAMRDIASLALYVGRTLFGLHMFSFRRAEYPSEVFGVRGLRRMPPANYDGDLRFQPLFVKSQSVPVQDEARPGCSVPPAAESLAAPAKEPAKKAAKKDGAKDSAPLPGDPPLHLRLTHICRAESADGAATRLPVLLLHGFGSGSVQFTHPAIPQPLAPWLANRGHDVWVADLRTSIGLPSSRLQWSMDDVALNDIPALVKAVCVGAKAEQVHVVAHCIGSAMFSMALLAGKLVDDRSTGRPLVASAALLQVGPEVVVPRASRARAYVAARVRQLVGASEAQSVASQNPTDVESFFDRIIGSYLYPENERLHYRLGGDVRRNAERINASRSAVIFGQLFQHQNMTRGQLRVLDDLLGSCNLTTYEQTTQYAFEERLTNQAGEDAYVTHENLRQHFDIPLLLVHGLENLTFFKETLNRNLELLSNFSSSVTAVRVEGYGHLDSVVGDCADSKVFEYIDKHLKSFEPGAKGLRETAGDNGHDDRHRVRLPRVGPWIGDARVDAGSGKARLRVGVRLDTLGRRALGVNTLVCQYGKPLQPLPQKHSGAPKPGACAHERFFEIELPEAFANADLEVLVTAANGKWPKTNDELLQRVGERLHSLKAKGEIRALPPEALPGLRIDAEWLQRLLDPQPHDLGLVLGACRQRPLLVDRDMADRSMRAVAAELDGAAAKPGGTAKRKARRPGDVPIDAVILCGDQVYADSQVDAGNTGSTQLRFLDAHHEAWSAPGQREVFRRRPVYMTVDDHEFRNDYNNVIAKDRPVEFGYAKSTWTRYQKDAGPPPPAPEARWRELRLRGFPVFLADTRSERFDPPLVGREHGRIMSDDQMKRLQAWLLKRHQGPDRDRTKIVVIASPIAPWFVEACEHRAQGTAVRTDSWQRFPNSVADLLGYIAEHGIEHVLFLSGDYHRPADAQLTLKSGDRSVNARCIVTGGLYCPYPFANASPEEWLQAATGLSAGPGATWDYRLQQIVDAQGNPLEADADTGSGYTRISLRAPDQVSVHWRRTDGSGEDRHVWLERARRR